MPESRLLFLTALASLFAISAQGQINARLKAADSAQLKVIRVLPDSFPRVKVVFKAATPSGIPVWNLKDTQVRVLEDDAPGCVTGLRMITNKRPLCVSLVVDHSGSMAEDYNQLYDPKTSEPLFRTVPRAQLPADYYAKQGRDLPADTSSGLIDEYPASYISPLTSAKKAVSRFLKSMDFKKDLVSLVGFSTSTDVNSPLTSNPAQLLKLTQGMLAEGNTAFYDGMWTALEGLKNTKGIRAVVAMTDGHDNTSQHTLKEVIRKAKNLDIPVFVVGLGDVNQNELQRLAKKTNGFFYYTENAKDLPDIYQTIARSLQAIYELEYESPNMRSADTSRDFSISFHVDDIYLKQNLSRLDLPEEVIERLKVLEQSQVQEHTAEIKSLPAPESTTNPWLLGGILVSVSAAGAGTLAIKFRKKLPAASGPTPFSTVQLQNVYPNPASSQTTVKLTGADQGGKLQITDMNGRIIQELTVPGGSISIGINVSELQSGQYLLRMHSDGNVSEALKLMVQKN